MNQGADFGPPLAGPDTRQAKSIAVILIFFAIGCALWLWGPQENPVESSYETKGTQSERIAEVSTIISKHAALPGRLLDAHFFEHKDGDGMLGPSDFQAYYALSIEPTEVEAWRSLLQPLEPQNAKPRYAAPKQAPSWWLSQNDFPNLEFHSPRSLTGRVNGWIGIDAKSGQIFIFTFTT